MCLNESKESFFLFIHDLQRNTNIKLKLKGYNALLKKFIQSRYKYFSKINEDCLIITKMYSQDALIIKMVEDEAILKKLLIKQVTDKFPIDMNNLSFNENFGNILIEEEKFRGFFYDLEGIKILEVSLQECHDIKKLKWITTVNKECTK